MEELYKKVIELFKQNSSPGHDFKHALRTAALARKIAENEGYDTKEAEITGLLHDIGRTLQREHAGHAQTGVPLAKKLLDTYTTFDDQTKEQVLSAIESHSNFTTEDKLANILQDADKLDGLGATGISRAYLATAGLPDYDPNNITPEPGEYCKPTTIHQQIRFQMKWYDMLYTKTAKKIGKPKYEFMKTYFEQIKKEIEESK